MAWTSTVDERFGDGYVSLGADFYDASNLINSTFVLAQDQVAYGNLTDYYSIADQDVYSLGSLSTGHYSLDVNQYTWDYSSLGYGSVARFELLGAAGNILQTSYSTYTDIDFTVYESSTYYVKVIGSSFDERQYSVSYAKTGEITVINSDAFFSSASYVGDLQSGSTIAANINYYDADGYDAVTLSSGLFTGWFLQDNLGFLEYLGGGYTDSITLTDEMVGKTLLFNKSFFDSLGNLEASIRYTVGLIEYGVDVQRSTSFILPESDHVLTLTLTGSSNIYGYGNSNNNSITGNTGNNTLKGGAGNDILYGLNGYDTLHGDSGSDKLYGGSDNDLLVGGAGSDKLYGGNDNDLLVGGAGSDVLDGGSGIDRAEYTDATAGVLADLQYASRNTGIAAGDTYVSIENLYGSRFYDNLRGDAAANVLWGHNGNDRLYGRGGNDNLQGMKGNDILYGQGGNDRLYGQGGNDRLYGGAKNDLLVGGAGLDRLQGDAGKDTMLGGSGADIFIFNKLSDSSATASGADVIKDFTHGVDHIDLRLIDASTKISGNNAFTFDGTMQFGTSNQGDIYYKQFNLAGTNNDHTMVYIDNDADSGIEMSIRLSGLVNLTAGDFLL